ncbi:hypothetical protein JW711_03520 [Candidatus Woesearchaeota archaeon]|nr:hypothetical protein [Candidatus Woesearchaeota archaeon]
MGMDRTWMVMQDLMRSMSGMMVVNRMMMRMRWNRICRYVVECMRRRQDPGLVSLLFIPCRDFRYDYILQTADSTSFQHF